MRVACIALFVAWVAGCGSNAVGAGCSATQPCAAPFVCASTDREGVTVCMRPCEVDPATGVNARLCADGSACLGADGSAVCYVGGHTPYGQPCTGELDCEPGTVCSPDAICEQACTVGFEGPCTTTEVCTDVADGVCRRAMRATCSDAHPCTLGALCSPDLAICEMGCTVGDDTTCDEEEVCADVGGGLCRRAPGTKCSDIHPCAVGLTCTPEAMTSPPVSFCR